MDKSELRQTALQNRRSLKAQLKQSYDQQICDQLLALTAVQNAKTIGVYSPTGGEVNINSFVAACRKRGVRVVLPMPPFDDIAFVLCETRNEQKPTAISLEEIEVVVVPIVAFDEKCNRLGRGSGYYDRVITARPQALFVGVAYECQQTKDMPVEPHDKQVDLVVTEARIKYCKKLT